MVILVEDDAGLRGALKRVLRDSGFETRVYASAEAALADPAPDWPDCLVIDLNLAGMSGLDLLHGLRQRGITAPAVVISAHDEARVREEVRRRGVEHFLAKPFRGTTLVGVLGGMLAQRSGGGRAPQ